LYASILIPVDGSENSTRAAKHAIDLAARFNSKLIGLHVIDIRVMKAAEGSSKISSMLESFGEGYLKDLVALASASKVKVETSLKEGLPADVIIEEAEERRVDLIVMGTRGLTGAKRVILGSTAEQVIRWAPCPVLVIK
jgi:nucleotide-binding universal stress UspA family protein